MHPMRRHLDLLTELFDQPVLWDWVKPEHEAQFTIGAHTYAVIFASGDEGRGSEVWFGLVNQNAMGRVADTKATGTGNQFAVLSTVNDIVLAYLEEAQP